MKNKLYVDFDGVLIAHNTIPTREDWWNDEPTKNAKEAIEYLSKKYRLVIFTSRPRKEWPAIDRWLERHQFPKLNKTNVKSPQAFCFIDDRAIRFTSWLDICKILWSD